MQITRILVPSDFSANASAAIEPARMLAQRFGAHLDLLHVWESPPAGLPEWNLLRPDGTPVSPRALLKDLASQQMDKLLGELRGSGMTVHGRLEEGNAWRAITRVAKDDHYDLIVLSTHGYTGAERLFMGSVAEKVVRHAPCAVFIVRPEAAASRHR